MGGRRALVLMIGLATGMLLAALLWRVLAPGAWTTAKAVMLLSFVGLAPWVGLCTANGLIGFVRAAFQPSPAAAGPPGPLSPTAIALTAIALTVRNEDMNSVLPPVRRLLDQLDRLGAGRSFALFVLSDSDSGHASAERAAVEAFRAAEAYPGRIRYRRRAVNEGYKAGNIMDFLDHHAGGFDLMLVLDADSWMEATAVLRLVHTIQANPSLAIVQHLTVGRPAASAFPRLFQFGMRAGMRIWVSGIDWWQGDQACYWGHNALVRIAPFRTHARLTLLPGGRHVLSHDQVEAAMLQGAGWGVRVLPVEDGSAESNPPALPEFLRRELRWLTGNFDYRHVLTMRGLSLMGRWQLVQAILLFGSTPFYLTFLLAAAWAAATDTTSAFPAEPALVLTLGWAGGLYAPKLLGYLELLLSRRKRARYGGAARLVLGAFAEILFSLLFDAVSVVSKAIGTARLALGMRAGWAPQNRADRGVSWPEAGWLLWPHTLLGVMVFMLLRQAGWTAVLWAVPFAGGLLVAIPFCVLTAHPRFGRWLRHAGVAAVPEEIPDETNDEINDANQRG
jgi:membrane glycosyltransferase